MNKINGNSYTSIKQSVEDVINIKLYPTPELNFKLDDEGFMKITINPTHDLCEIFRIKNSREYYKTWIRKNHKNVLANNKEKDDIKRKKMVFK